MKTATDSGVKHPGGRPRKPERTLLIAALIDRQDAFARRWAARIAELLRVHVPLDEVEASWRTQSRRVRAKFADLPAAYLAQRPDLENPAAVARVLHRLVHEALEELADVGEDPARDPIPPEPRPVVHRSRSLAEARAQAAQLQVQYMDLRARCRARPTDGRQEKETTP